jgi:hypothetical protein
MEEPKFQPGFRLSWTDVIILIVGGAASGYAMTMDRWLGVAIAFVVSHFFLFCNVLRMSRSLELIWAGVFTILAAATTCLSLLSWPIVFVLSAAMTIVVAMIEASRPSYHGIGWRRINPRLPEWWRSNATAASATTRSKPR